MKFPLLLSLLALLLAGSCGKSRGPDIGRSGSVCGGRDIIGQMIAPIDGPGSCGIDRPVKLYSVAGVSLSQHATVRCETARALGKWIRRGIKPAIGRTGGGVEELRVASHYACRSRNSRRGAKLSEHARGNAIDVSAFVLRNGSEISVERDWGRGKYGRILKQIHRSACGPFGTVLGPNSDRHHRDHFHGDVARYGNGNYCR
ncbi:MAG: extensin family protein [Paracoccaceae bacterium]